MRKLILGAAAATLLAAWFAPDDEGMIVSPAAAAASAPATEPGTAPAIPAELQIQRRVADEDLGNLFSSTGWQAPSPLKPAAARAPQEQLAGTGGAKSAGGAPPLPFQFMGRFVDDGKVAYFLQMEDRNIVARIGEKVGDHYLLEGAANGALTFTYLPLNLKQTLAVGDQN